MDFKYANADDLSMDFKYANADGLGTKKHEDLPLKHMNKISYTDGLYTYEAEDGTIWMSYDTYTWRKLDAQINSNGR